MSKRYHVGLEIPECLPNAGFRKGNLLRSNLRKKRKKKEPRKKLLRPVKGLMTRLDWIPLHTINSSWMIWWVSELE